MDPITLSLGAAALVSAGGGFGTLVTKLVQSLRAERTFKQKVAKDTAGHILDRVSLPGQGRTEHDAEVLRLRMIDLIAQTEMTTGEKKLLLAGLQQSSKIGRKRMRRSYLRS